VVDSALGGGLSRGALHEIAAVSEAHLAAATGFALGLAALRGKTREKPRALTWIAEDMALAESGAPYGPGLDAFGLAPERLLSVAVAHRRDLMGAMEEALRCRAVGAVIGEVRHGALDPIAVRRLSLAAATSGALAILLRARPQRDASTAATRWIVGAAPSSPSPAGGRSPSEAKWGGVSSVKGSPPPGGLGRADLPPPGGGERKYRRQFEFGPARFAAQLIRNRRGPTASWIFEWSDDDECFIRATPALPVAAPPADRPRRAVA
jgi:protein ImuA